MANVRNKRILYDELPHKLLYLETYEYEYDNYERLKFAYYDGNLIKYNIYDQSNYNSSPINIGKLIVSNVYKLDAGNPLYDDYVYDEFGRIDKIISNHHLCFSAGPRHSTLPCGAEEQFTYDFADNILLTNKVALFNNQINHDENIYLVDSMTYDHAGRMVNHYYTVDGDQQLIANHAYTLKDELEQKNLGGYGSDYLQSLDFTYLSNGFLKRINQPLLDPYLVNCPTQPPIPENSAGADLFYLELGYDSKVHSSIPSEIRNNGDISQMIWETKGRLRFGYGFEYDGLDRITAGNYERILGNGSLYSYAKDGYSVDIAYKDLIGNIASIKRNGSDDACGKKEEIDDLTFSYHGESSEIKDVEDSALHKKKGFPAYDTNQGKDYEYDDNGNMTYDPSRKVSIVYNRLNLPDSLIFDDGKLIHNLYDHAGTKLRQSTWIKPPGATVAIRSELRDYIDQFELIDGHIHAVNHAEGRVSYRPNPTAIILPDTIQGMDLYHHAAKVIVPSIVIDSSNVLIEASQSIEMIHPFFVEEDGSNNYEARIATNPADTGWQWEYYIKDHLGNLRLTFSDLNKDGVINVSLDSTNEVLEEHHYYPFGLKHNGPWLARKNQGFANKYNYNGKEELPFTGYLYYGARFYDPSIARFSSVDPLASEMPAWSPYSYAFNNPVRFIDPTGMAPEQPTPEEASVLIKHTYADGQGVDLIGGWQQVGDFTNKQEESGYMAGFYSRVQEDGDTEYAYVTRGSDVDFSQEHTKKDWQNNIRQITKGDAEQYTFSVREASRLSNAYKDNELTFVGHSLGGGLASANSLATGRGGVTFNAAGLSNRTIKKMGLDINNASNISAHIIRGEIVDYLQRGSGVNRAAGNRTVYKQNYPERILFVGAALPRRIKQHYIESFDGRF